eukprot:10475944-Alexandrium_andersonii.AAC.1
MPQIASNCRNQATAPQSATKSRDPLVRTPGGRPSELYSRTRCRDAGRCDGSSLAPVSRRPDVRVAPPPWLS